MEKDLPLSCCRSTVVNKSPQIMNYPPHKQRLTNKIPEIGKNLDDSTADRPQTQDFEDSLQESSYGQL